MTDVPSPGQRLTGSRVAWMQNPRALGKVGFPLVVVSAIILWIVIDRRPEPPPESLSELDRVVGTVESLSVDYRPLYTTRRGRRAVVHEREQKGLVLELKLGKGERSAWGIETSSIGGPEQASKLREELRPGTVVTAYAREGQIFQLEGPAGVLVDLGHARARGRLESIAALALVILALMAGLVLCGRAVIVWNGEGGR
jgi:hypothetical protein